MDLSFCNRKGLHTYLMSYIVLQTGDHLHVEIAGGDADTYPEDDLDGFALHQISAILRREPIACKPAPFDTTDDMAMSLPSGTLPRRSRPFHDGAAEWSLQLGVLFRTAGDLDVWDDSFAMECHTRQ